MQGKLIEVVEYGNMVDEVYLEEDGSYFHNIYYKEEKRSSEKKGE